MMFAMLAATMAAAALSQDSMLERRDAVPIPRLLSDMSALFGIDSYPQEAVARREQGRVAFDVIVDTGGHVEGCTVTESSGSVALDQETCDILIEKARFQPAVDEKGKPVLSHWRSAVRWIFEPNPFVIDRDIRYPVDPSPDFK